MLQAGVSVTQTLQQAGDTTLYAGLTQDQVALNAATTLGVGAGHGGESLYNAANVLNPNTQSPVTDYKTARELEQGAREDFVRTWAGWSDRQLWQVHSHLSDQPNSELNQLLQVTPALERRGLERYLPQLERAGRHTTTTLEAQIPDRAYGHRVVKANSVYQFNVEHFRVLGNVEAFVHVPVQNFNFQQALHNGKYLHMATDVLQQSHVHVFRRAEDSLTDVAHATVRYNTQSLYETSANAKHVAGDQQFYSDAVWYQVGQPYPNAAAYRDGTVDPPLTHNEHLLHPYRTQLSGRWGTEVRLITDELETVTYLNNIDFEANNAFNVRTNWAPITLFAARDCPERRLEPGRPPQGPCLGDIRLGAKDSLVAMTYDGDIHMYAGVGLPRRYRVGATLHIEQEARVNHYTTARQQVHVWAGRAVYVDAPEVCINCRRARDVMVPAVRVAVPPKPYQHRVYAQMGDIHPYHKQGLLEPTAKTQIEPRTPDAVAVKNGPEHLGLYEHVGATPTRSRHGVGTTTTAPVSSVPPTPQDIDTALQGAPPQPAPVFGTPRPQFDAGTLVLVWEWQGVEDGLR